MDERTPQTPASALPDGKASRPAAKKRRRRKKEDGPAVIGRPRKRPEEILKNGTIRLTEADWETYYALGGTDWLRKAMRRAKAAKAGTLP